jgi:probable rRNA maturation factor
VPVRVAWQAGPALVADVQLVAAVEAALAHGGRAGLEIDLVLVDDAFLAELHGQWLGDRAPTDVISFDLGEDPAGPAGEVYASVDCARRVAQEQGHDPGRELVLYVIHGVLHLCGYDDHEPGERRAMRRAEREVQVALGLDPLPSTDTEG